MSLIFERIRLRRDTAANWTTNNPTLALAEPGYETDTGKIKLGDGATAWTALAYRFTGGTTNAVDAQVDFGTTNREDFATVVVPATWVAAGSNIVVSPGIPTTTDHDVEDALLEGLTASVQSITAGVSFVLGVHAPNATWGRYDFVCIGV